MTPLHPQVDAASNGSGTVAGVATTDAADGAGGVPNSKWFILVLKTEVSARLVSSFEGQHLAKARA